VSDNAIRKWRRAYEAEHDPPGEAPVPAGAAVAPLPCTPPEEVPATERATATAL
jgi:transposase-like protein